MTDRLSIVVPCFNEEEVLPMTHGRVISIGEEAVASGLCQSYEVVYVDDGSRDATFAMLASLSRDDDRVKVVRLATNFGHQSAILAGYTYATGNRICSIDADLQDPPELILEMLQQMQQGIDIVFAVRSSRNDDTWFKRVSAHLFYRVMLQLGVNTIPNHADYRMFTNTVRDVLLAYSEVNLFLRATFANLGFSTSQVYYVRPKRAAGTTKYPLRRMIEFAINGITSYSIVPLRLCTLTGALSAVVALCSIAWSLYVKYMFNAATGWTSIVASIYLLGGIQLLFIGILGEYLGKIYIEVKRRPRYTVRTLCNIHPEEAE
jgi:glycosyltransferase involved in cell wall biosynthesis